MSDKPDVAALVEWLQTWSPVTENGKRAHLAASELTRLAAENRTYAEEHAFNSERFADMLSERDEAKAEIARLREALVDHNDALRSAFMGAQRDGIHDTRGTSNYNLMADSFHNVLAKHHAISNEARAALKPDTK